MCTHVCVVALCANPLQCSLLSCSFTSVPLPVVSLQEMGSPAVRHEHNVPLSESAL